MNPDPASQACRNNQGMALFGVLMILAALSVIAGTVFTAVKSNVAVTGHHKKQQESFFQADAAVNYVLNQLSEDMRNGVVDLNQASVSLNYAAPSGYSFDTVTNITRLANTNYFLLNVTGRSRGAQTHIEAILGRKSALGRLGIFGDEDLGIQPGFDVYSYNSDEILHPTPADSTNEAGIGSNEAVTLQPGVDLDGSIFLGISVAGIEATVSGAGSIPILRIPRVDPDPLGAIGGPLAAAFTYFSSAAHNNNAAAGIANNTYSLSPHSSNTLASGVYYLDDFNLGNHAQLYIESTPDAPAVIFLTGDFVCSSSSEFHSRSESPRALYIFSNSTDEFRLQPNSEFRGFVYTPYADLKVMPNDDAYGVFWGSTATLQPGGDLYVDTTLLDEFKSGMLETVQWKEIRD